jgi:hypothetical protein
MTHLLKQTVVFIHNFQQTANKQQRTYGVANLLLYECSYMLLNPSLVFIFSGHLQVIISDAKEYM